MSLNPILSLISQCEYLFIKILPIHNQSNNIGLGFLSLFLFPIFVAGYCFLQLLLLKTFDKNDQADIIPSLFLVNVFSLTTCGFIVKFAISVVFPNGIDFYNLTQYIVIIGICQFFAMILTQSLFFIHHFAHKGLRAGITKTLIANIPIFLFIIINLWPAMATSVHYKKSKDLSFMPSKNIWVYYTDKAHKTLYRIRPDGTSKQLISAVLKEGKYGQSKHFGIILSSDNTAWDLCQYEFFENESPHLIMKGFSGYRQQLEEKHITRTEELCVAQNKNRKKNSKTPINDNDYKVLSLAGIEEVLWPHKEGRPWKWDNDKSLFYNTTTGQKHQFRTDSIGISPSNTAYLPDDKVLLGYDIEHESRLHRQILAIDLKTGTIATLTDGEDMFLVEES